MAQPVKWYVGSTPMGSPSTMSLHGRSAESRDGALVLAVRWCVALVLTAAALYYAYKSIHWQIMIDSTVMHYVNFLIEHGRKPYAEITDNNMPGAYYTEALAMRIFGAGDVGWRIYDYCQLATMTAALMLIARGVYKPTGDWLAGLFAGGLFIAVHAAEGPQYSVEREQTITVLLVLGYVALFAAVRRRQPRWMLALGLVSGVAASIKPSFLPLTLVLLGMMVWKLRRERIAWLPYAGWATLGLLAVAALDLGYLLYYGALRGFLFILRDVTPTYTSLGRLSFWQLVRYSLPEYIPLLLALTVLAMLAGWRGRARWTWETWALAVGAAFGLASFMAQGKPFWHHRYTFLVLLFLLIGMELLAALRQRGLPRVLAMAAFAYVLLWIVPREMREVLHLGRMMAAGQTPFTLTLEGDLDRLGGTDALQDKVQCFDLVFGCMSALYHLRIVENTSYTGDLLLFPLQDSAATEYYRAKYWELEKQDPAQVIVMSNEWFQQPNSFDKVDYWPAFKLFLAENYTLVVQRRLEHQGLDPNNPEAYRIYVRKTSPLLGRAAALQAKDAGPL
jgi:hypothetical protein